MPCKTKHAAIFWQGMVLNVLNPKCALFFFAFLPQFIKPAMGNVTGQVIFFGLLFTLLAFMTDGFYGLRPDFLLISKVQAAPALA